MGKVWEVLRKQTGGLPKKEREQGEKLKMSLICLRDREVNGPIMAKVLGE